MSKKRSFFHYLITFICIAVIIVSLVAIFMQFYPKFEQAKNYDEIKEVATTPQEDLTQPNLINWDELLAINPETVGWITVPGTHIDYPVVQTSDNDYYLHHNFEGEYSGYGTPFLDTTFDWERFPIAQNSVLYGHNSTWGNQIGFEGLEDYGSIDYYKEHPVIYYTTVEDGNIPVPYEVVAAVKVENTYDYRRPDFKDQIDFIEYYNRILGDKVYDTGKVIYQNDQLVTLSSCIYDVKNGRIAVIARRIDPKPSSSVVVDTEV